MDKITLQVTITDLHFQYQPRVSIKQHTRTPQNSPVIAKYGSFVSSKFDQKLTHYGAVFNIMLY